MIKLNASIVLLLLLVIFTTNAGYKVTAANQTLSTVTLLLVYTGNDTYYIKPSSPIIPQLLFKLVCHTQQDFSVRITDANKARFEVPQEGVFPVDPVKNFTFPLSNSRLIFTYTENPFSFTLIRPIIDSSNREYREIIFNTSVGDLIYSDRYIEFSTIASHTILGLGERFADSFNLHNGTYTLFNRGLTKNIDTGKGNPSSGYYPVYLARDDINFHFNLVYLRNSNAMDVVVTNYSQFTKKLTYKIIGGIIDLRFIVVDTNPEEALQRLRRYTGKAAVPPFWAMGFHQSRRGYRTADELAKVIKGYEDNDIPLDAIWSDIDYMVDSETFTFDEKRFPSANMSKIMDKYKYVLTLPASIKVGGGAYAEGQKQGVFLKSAEGTEFAGSGFAGKSAFVDYFNANASTYWHAMLNVLYSKIKFSGAWLTLNEQTNFCDGPCEPQNKTGFDFSKDLPYTPGSVNLETNTVSLNATHAKGYTEAEVHPFTGLLQSSMTRSFLLSKGVNQPFIVSDSTTLGSHKFASHTTGANEASFEALRGSLYDNMNLQLWGNQITGSDICGYNGNTTAELCARWFQLGAFYPLARNHNNNDTIPQQAYALEKDVMTAARVNLKLRYSLLKQLYSYLVIDREASAYFSPTFVKIWRDYLNSKHRDDQFMIGPFLIAPIVEQGKTSRTVTFPCSFNEQDAGSNWYRYPQGPDLQGCDSYTFDNNITDQVLTFIRGGNIVFVQNTTNVTHSSQLSNNHFNMVVALYETQETWVMDRRQARGSLLSIHNYHDEATINTCLQEGCEYTFHFIQQSQLFVIQYIEIVIGYKGPARLQEKLLIPEVLLLTGGEPRRLAIRGPLVIDGPGRIILEDYGNGYEQQFVAA